MARRVAAEGSEVRLLLSYFWIWVMVELSDEVRESEKARDANLVDAPKGEIFADVELWMPEFQRSMSNNDDFTLCALQLFSTGHIERKPRWHVTRYSTASSPSS